MLHVRQNNSLSGPKRSAVLFSFPRKLLSLCSPPSECILFIPSEARDLQFSFGLAKSFGPTRP